MNKFRLKSNIYDREKDNEKINPKKIYFLSVEGNKTEVSYFLGISRYKELLGINAKVDLEVLQRSRKDTSSAPKHVLELLEEYIRLRNLNDDFVMNEIPNELITKYGLDTLKQYIDSPISIERNIRQSIDSDLTKIGYDLNYRKYLKNYNTEYDEFGILIDRDMNSNPNEDFASIIKYCEDKQYAFYMTNPCFEFWLLLHLCDVAEVYKERFDLIKENKKISNRHTYISNEVSLLANHYKNDINFETNYLPNVEIAIERAKKFPYHPKELINHIGCNIWILIERMKNS